MSDIYTKAERSRLMSLIRSAGNKSTELRLIAIMRSFCITGWRRNYRVLGNPDFVFRHARVAVFVDGCFWHGCPIHCRFPTGNRTFWLKKLTANKSRDQRVTRALRHQGWHVIRIWEHDLVGRPGICVGRIARAIGAQTNVPGRRRSGMLPAPIRSKPSISHRVRDRQAHS